jgi:ATP phosphoribosyltransferase regulatory subunit
MTPAVLIEAERLKQHFLEVGAQPVEAEILQPAGTLLDLYGEDIRARAYTTHDPLRGEQMLRPDFTVPVVQMHMLGGADPARYTYAGRVFRQQSDPTRATEYMQVGYELFARENVADADAEVFALIASALAHLNLTPVTGDIGILMAAVRGLSTSEARKNALLRHIWRPVRFRQLLDRYSGRGPARAPVTHTSDAPLNGLRSRAEIETRIAALAEDAQTPPIKGDEVRLIDAILAINDTAPNALASLQNLTKHMPILAPAVERFSARLDALSARGIDVATLPFETDFGRTLLEYYDGFVFGFHADHDTPPIATGGRYDALTRQLGQGASIPAVGGVIRPGLIAELDA